MPDGKEKGRGLHLWFNRPSWWFCWILQSENHYSLQNHHHLSASVCGNILTAFWLIFLLLLLLPYHPFSTEQPENFFVHEILQRLPMSIKLIIVFLTLAYKSLHDLATLHFSLHLSRSHNTGLLFLLLEHTMLVSATGPQEKLAPQLEAFLSFESQFGCFLFTVGFTLMLFSKQLLGSSN